MIEIHLFEQLVAFADCGTLSAAAEQLHISQPALSRSMQRLEDELEIKIFDRNKSRLSLNENGELAVKYARNLLLQETSMIQQLRDFDRKKRTISVGFCAPALIPEFVALLSRLYEGMALSTEVTGDPRLPEHLAEGRYQLAILHDEPDPERFCSCPLDSEQLYISLPPVHPLADSQGLYLKELDGQTFLLYSQTGFWDDLCRRKMPSSRFLMQTEMEVLGELVANSALPAFTTDYIMKRNGEISDRITIPVLDKEASVTYYCVCPRDNADRFRRVFRYLRSRDSLPADLS